MCWRTLLFSASRRCHAQPNRHIYNIRPAQKADLFTGITEADSSYRGRLESRMLARGTEADLSRTRVVHFDLGFQINYSKLHLDLEVIDFRLDLQIIDL